MATWPHYSLIDRGRHQGSAASFHGRGGKFSAIRLSRAALETLALDLGARAGVPIVLDADPELGELALPLDIELVLYRAAQEAVNNALRHAHAHNLRIALQRHGNTVRLRVADDSIGFVAPAHLDGLAGLRQRMRRAGGRVSVASAPAQGTVVQVEFSTAPTGEAATGEAATGEAATAQSSVDPRRLIWTRWARNA